ncbi:MAG: hypothetical protein NTU79_01210 [Planctomycetota bacterium]|nr:hypothetical protein [Planctomycetota bacterium]
MPVNLPEPNEVPDDAAPATSTRRVSTTPPYRRLRVFAFDPLLSNQLETLAINQITLQVPWEDGLRPGPIGEYVEVVDYDPEIDNCHEPVDLNHPHLLATDGLPPSEGNMKFHQQMVYAVSMTTIRHFEQALGRRALWAPRRFVSSSSGENEFVARLRIYPHALRREANAYYSPEKKSLLFGYFPASTAAPGRNLPGGTIFTCLSHDVIAHETTHALLDGMHQRFVEPNNPDVLAFHEAFADIVALFQHFSFPEVLRHQIARTKGDLTDQNLLGQLALQFGEAVGMRGALRDALGSVNPKTQLWEFARPDPAAIRNTTEPHARGAILVAAVFDAFISIYKSRSTDLLRLATGGTGVLSAGELHPDLVNRLAAEAVKSAHQILTMCIRALDYCPPVDITFGEYLRALITADTELIHDDDLGYRIAVTEAFRRRGLYPLGVQSLAADSLVWQSVEDISSGEVCRSLRGRDSKALLEKLNRWNLSASRKQVFEDAHAMQVFLHAQYRRVRDSTNVRLFEQATGLALTDDAPWSIRRSKQDGMPSFEVHAVRPARRVGPDGQLTQRLIVEITQKRSAFDDPQRQEKADRGEFADSQLDKADFVFRGGSTLIYDLETAQLLYCIRKNVRSEERLRLQREFLSQPDSESERAAFFSSAGCAEPFALLHHNRFQVDSTKAAEGTNQTT